METLEIHGRSFLLKWVNAEENSEIHWQLKPVKKSVNFGIYKSIGSHFSTIEPVLNTSSSSNITNLSEKLKVNGLSKLSWYDKCVPNELIHGSLRVEPGQAGTFAFVFDNTFSRNKMKTVLFSQHIEFKNETIDIPSSINSLANNIVTSKGGKYVSGILLKKRRKKHQGYIRRYFQLNYKYSILSYYSNEKSSLLRGSMPIKLSVISAQKKNNEIVIDSGMELWYLKAICDEDWNVWVKALDLARLGATSYSNNPQPSLITNNTKVNNNINEVIHDYDTDNDVHYQKLLLINEKIENAKRNALNLAANLDINKLSLSSSSQNNNNQQNIDSLAGPSTSTRNINESVKSSPSRRRASIWKKKKNNQNNQNQQRPTKSRRNTMESIPSSDLDTSSNDRLLLKPHHNNHSSESNILQNNNLKHNSESSLSMINNTPNIIQNNNNNTIDPKIFKESESLCLLISEISKDFSKLINNYNNVKQKFHLHNNNDQIAIARTLSHISSSTTFSLDNFEDAMESLDDLESRVILINDDENNTTSTSNNHSINDIDDDDSIDSSTSSSSSSVSTSSLLIPTTPKALHNKTQSTSTITRTSTAKQSIITKHEHDLYPLPLKPINRRKDIPIATSTPPSLIAFFRKNVGKDFSSIAMPVTANEPLSLLQRFAESFECASLINESLNKSSITGEQLLYISTFVITSLSNNRSKDKVQRKPFNPMLGETFEYISTKDNFRLIGEKINHRPVVLAYHVDSFNWCYDIVVTTGQKFWGKSVEIITKGTATLKIYPKESEAKPIIYKWDQPQTYLRNIIAGEKYIEPVNSVKVFDLTNLKHSIINFGKQGGVFRGRNENVDVIIKDDNSKSNNNILPMYIDGKWIDKLILHFKNQNDKDKDKNKNDKIIWEKGNLLSNSSKKYGFTEFAVTLNDISLIEKDKLSPTDSRFRPDMKFYENGDMENAERWKLQLEQWQRERRWKMEENGKEHVPKFFRKKEKKTNEKENNENNEDEEESEEYEWEYIEGEMSYWERRKRGDWGDLLNLWEENKN